MDTAATREFLRAQMANRPESRLQDLCKALYQSTFGCGHLISDVTAAEQSIREELAAGNSEFADAEKETLEALRAMDMPEVEWFLENFAGAFGLTLDGLQRG